MQAVPLSSSFRDPCGFVFLEEGSHKRAVTFRGRSGYDRLMNTGLYDELTGRSLLLTHTEAPPPQPQPAGSPLYTVLCPDQVQVISYPYEWSFDQLKDAALLTLDIQQRAMDYGMSLKDASAFNVQFRGSQPVFIDTLSFEENRAGPWIAYQQFCRHFLAPLLLMSHIGPRANQYLRVELDGIPLDFGSRMLPMSTWLNPGLLIHIHLHARAIAKNMATPVPRRSSRARDTKRALVQSLRTAIASIRPPHAPSPWLAYTENSSHYPPLAAVYKRAVVKQVLRNHAPSLVYDLGANTGEFSRLAAESGAYCVSCDSDPLCVNAAYLRERNARSRGILPLVIDLCNPTPAAGFGLDERMSIFERPVPELVLALALVHHLRLSGNIPFAHQARFFRRLTRNVVIEFATPLDPMVKAMVAQRTQPLPDDYSLEAFLAAFDPLFYVREVNPLPEMSRFLCTFEARN